MKDRRKNPERRQEDREESGVMSALRTELKRQGIDAEGCSRADLVPFTVLTHLQRCEKRSAETAKKLDDFSEVMEINHSQNKKKLDDIKTVNEEQLELLQGLVTARRVSLWAGRGLKWLLGLAASAAAALGLWQTLRHP